jgi:hypothetical protein
LVGIGVVAGGTGVAAGAGGYFLLGKANTAVATSSLSNTGSGTGLGLSASHGSPLTLHAPAGQPPLTVNSSKEVSKLNAALLDGQSAAAFVKSAAVIYAFYNTSELVPALTHGFTKITRKSNGAYCLQPEAGINPSKTVAMVTPEFEFSSGSGLEASIAVGLCPAGQFGVVTQKLGSDSNAVAFEIEVI